MEMGDNGSTVDSRYLEVQGILLNTSRYPYRDISDFAELWKKYIKQPHSTNKYANLIPEIRDALKILWKRGEIAP